MIFYKFTKTLIYLLTAVAVLPLSLMMSDPVSAEMSLDPSSNDGYANFPWFENPRTTAASASSPPTLPGKTT